MEFVRRGGAVAAGAGGREWRDGLSRRVLEGKARRLLQAKGRQSFQGLEVGLGGQVCRLDSSLLVLWTGPTNR